MRRQKQLAVYEAPHSSGLYCTGSHTQGSVRVSAMQPTCRLSVPSLEQAKAAFSKAQDLLSPLPDATGEPLNAALIVILRYTAELEELARSQYKRILALEGALEKTESKGSAEQATLFHTPKSSDEVPVKAQTDAAPPPRGPTARPYSSSKPNDGGALPSTLGGKAPSCVIVPALPHDPCEDALLREEVYSRRQRSENPSEQQVFEAPAPEHVPLPRLSSGGQRIIERMQIQECTVGDSAGSTEISSTRPRTPPVPPELFQWRYAAASFSSSARTELEAVIDGHAKKPTPSMAAPTPHSRLRLAHSAIIAGNW